jgi:leader peptidase (prepilin peptidase)/N-methyltransferase
VSGGSQVLIAGTAVVCGLALGPWLAGATVRLIARDSTALPSSRRIMLARVLLAASLWAAAGFAGARPALVGFVAVAVAALVLGAVDLATHRLPDRATYPAAAVCVAAFAVDAVVLGTWAALLRAVLAAVLAFGAGALAASLSRQGLGFGDVKLLGLLGLILGWVSWETLATGVVLGLLTGALIAVALLATRRAGWRTALPFGPPLLVGAALALALHGPVPLG